MEDEFIYTYEKPKGEQRKVRGFLYVTHHYREPYTYYEKDGTEKRMVKITEHKHPSIIGKVVAVVLLPMSILLSGFVDGWRDTVRYIWDRKNGSFTAHAYFRERKGA